MIGPGIIVPLAILVVVIPGIYLWATTRFRPTGPGQSTGSPSALRLTSTALRGVPTPPWRIVHEIAADRLGGVEHVLIGPPGTFSITAVFAPLAAPGRDDDPSPAEVAAAAVIRGDVDDALRRCGLASVAHVTVHWGRTELPDPSVTVAHGAIAVDGHRLASWISSLESTSSEGQRLSSAEVDLAWQSVCLAIGRPDPLRAE